jgi:F0F1-type ATP synthase membrane subunit b/b'
MNLKFTALYSALALNFLGQTVYAASTSEGIPWSLVQAQTVNFTIFVIALIMLIRKPGAAFFAKFREDFLEESTKAQKIVANAEKQKKEIEEQLKKLETTYTSKLENSKKEAQALKDSIIKDSKERAEKMISDTQESAAVLFKSAEQGIKNHVLNIAVANAKTDLSKRIDSKESQRLHGEFLEEISAGSL